MGYRKTLDIKAKCPLYEAIVKTDNGSIAGIQCSYICEDFGFDASVVTRIRGGYKELMSMKELFCDDMYESCPYFKLWRGAHETESKR